MLEEFGRSACRRPFALLDFQYLIGLSLDLNCCFGCFAHSRARARKVFRKLDTLLLTQSFLCLFRYLLQYDHLHLTARDTTVARTVCEGSRSCLLSENIVLLERPWSSLLY